MQPLLKKKMAAKQGIALIVVLALLAMLVIMAVSFVVFMRTERTASRDYAEMVKARNIAQAAVTRALVHMQQDMNLSNQFYHGGYVYVPTSAGAERCTNWASPDLLLDHYVPGSVNQAALNTALKSTGPVFWTNLVIKTIGGANQLIGRYSYMVFDGSDFLDINTISNQVRGSGNYPGEVAMPAEITSPSVLVQERDTVRHPFESLCEVNLRNWDRTNPPRFIMRAGNAGDNQSQHLVTFSYVPVDTYFTNNAQKGRLYISTNAATIKGLVGNIKTVTSSLGFDPAFADNLADFADPSTDVPTNPNQMGGGKLVPMLYQIAVTNGLRQVTLAGKKAWEFETRVMYETWFPYSVTANKQYSVKLPSVPKVVINSTAPVLPATFPWAMVSNGWQTTATTITTLPPTILTPTNTFFTNAYVVVWRTLYTNALTLVNSTLTQPQSATVVNGIGGAGTTVDQAAFSIAPITFVASANKAGLVRGWGVVDPRINYRATDWRQNAAATVATLLGRTNEFCDVTGSKYDKDVDKNGDGSTFMYARRPTDPSGLHSIGDLGYLLYRPDKPWHTVRLTTPQNALKDNSAYVFNMLSILPTNRVYQGFVNPNSQDSGALLCAFLGASKARYYGEPGATTVDLAQATKLAQALINKGIKSGKANAYTNIADVCRLTGGFTACDMQTATGDTDLWKQKAVMGNSIGLLNPRQNYWLVLVCAQAVKTINPAATTYTIGTDFVTAEAQCLAYIWRDPYEDASDTAHGAGSRRHKMFVQFFKWL